jgi:hypothetical protein
MEIFSFRDTKLARLRRNPLFSLSGLPLSTTADFSPSQASPSTSLPLRIGRGVDLCSNGFLRWICAVRDVEPDLPDGSQVGRRRGGFVKFSDLTNSLKSLILKSWVFFQWCLICFFRLSAQVVARRALGGARHVDPPLNRLRPILVRIA